MRHYKTQSHVFSDAELGVISEVEEAIPLCPITERKKCIGDVKTSTNIQFRYDHEMMVRAQATLGCDQNATKFKDLDTDVGLTHQMFNMKYQPLQMQPPPEPFEMIMQNQPMPLPRNSWKGVSHMAKPSYQTQGEVDQISRLGTLSNDSVTSPANRLQTYNSDQHPINHDL